MFSARVGLAVVMGVALGCSVNEASNDDGSAGEAGAVGEGGAASGGSAGASGSAVGGVGGGTGGVASGGNGGDVPGGQGGTPACEFVPGSPCSGSTNCCPVTGTRYELPSDLSCKRLTNTGIAECYELDGAGGCGGGLAVTACSQKRTDSGWVVITMQTQPYGWPTGEWADCMDLYEMLGDTSISELPDCS